MCYLLCSSIAWPFSICSILALCFELGGLVPLNVATSQYCRVSLFFPSHPPLSWLMVSPWDFLLLPLSLWPQCDGGYCGALAQGGFWLGCAVWYPSECFSALGCDCGCTLPPPQAPGHPTSTWDAGVDTCHYCKTFESG